MSAVTLSSEEQRFLEGAEGAAPQLAMEILLQMAEIQGAERFIPISSAHVDGCAYEGDAIVDFVEHLARLGARVRVPTTLNAVSIETGNWRHLGIPEEFGTKARRIVDAYLTMGLQPTFTCSPYQTGYTLQFGEQVAWAESNALAFANSVFGARTERYGDFMDICAAITGRVPEVGLHLKENRRGQVLFTLADDVTPAVRAHDAFYPLLGYWIGAQSQNRIPVVEGIPPAVSQDRIKALLAASASSGAVALMHIVGVTPEAPQVEDAFQGAGPQQVIEITRQSLLDAYRELNTTAPDFLDAVVLGSPHFSPGEFLELAALTSGRSVHAGIRFLITTSQFAKAVAEANGSLREVERFGAEIIVDTCILLAPILAPGTRAIMTNSGKYAHYSPGRLQLRVLFGSLADCVASAVAGAPTVEGLPW